MTEGQLSYALSKQVPDMARGFVIQTSYGDLTIDSEEAEAFARLAERVLLKRLAKQRHNAQDRTAPNVRSATAGGAA